MNSQPASSYPDSYPDARIDQVLDALRTTEPPTGLEQRIAARLAQATEARALTTASSPTASSFFAVILTLSLSKGKDPRILLAPARRYAVAVVALTLLVTLTAILRHRAPATDARTASDTQAPSRVPHLRDSITVAKVGIAHSATAIPGLEGAELQSRHIAPPSNPALAAEGISAVAATTQVPRGFSLASHTPLQPTPVSLPPSAQDPDAIALAETLAPSRPAPPMPLTAQEKLILSATRPGQPIQLAEFDLARAPVLRAAAQARQTASIDRYVRSLLAPFAVADALSPTTFSQPQETSTPTSPPPSISSSN